MLPGQLANRRAIEIGQRLFGGNGQLGSQIEPEVLRRKHRFDSRVDLFLVRARRQRTRLARQFFVRHLPCIGTSMHRLKRQMPIDGGSVLAGDVSGAALQLADDRRIGKGGGVAQVSALSDVT